jgi:leader peptidase (prepilin peptidase)/N-methyltransferase
MSLASSLLLVLILVIASITDLKERIVPNRLTLGAALAGLLLAASSGPVAVLGALAAGIALAAPLLLVSLARPEGMGMGDVKLVCVIGIFLGWQAWPALLTGLLLAATAGALFAAGAHRRPSQVALPLAPFLALGTLPVLVLAA